MKIHIMDVLIFNLDNEYSNIAALLMATKGDLKVSDITSTLIEELHHKGDQSLAESGTTLMGQELQDGFRLARAHQRENREMYNCYQCGQPGHLMKDCQAMCDIEGKYISLKMESEALDYKLRNSEQSWEQSALSLGSLNDISY